jgi:hypothetical protein
MVLIKIDKDNVKGLVIDGYIPSFEYLKERLPDFRHSQRNPAGIIPRWGSSGYKDSIQKYLRKEELEEDQLRRLFCNSVDKLRNGFCPYVDPLRLKDEMLLKRRKSCRYLPITNNIGLGKGMLTQLKKRHPEVYSTITNEYAKEKGSGYILQTVLYNPKKEQNCGMIEKCCEDWITKLNFRLKNESDYTNFAEFTESMTKLLRFLYGHIEPW